MPGVTPCSCVSIVNFEQVNPDWDAFEQRENLLNNTDHFINI